MNVTTWNQTLLENADSLVDIFSYANVSTGSMLFGLLMIGIFFILMFRMNNLEFDTRMLAVSFVCFIISLGLRAAGLINEIFVILFIVMAAFTMLYKVITRNQ